MICTYKIEKRCKVFCSYESVKKLRKRDFSRAYSSLGELDEINFSRAVSFGGGHRTADNSLRADRNRPSFAAHTVIDPTTEAVQIVGRFRNGVEDAAHIFSTNKEMPLQIAGGGRREVGGVRSGLQTSPANRSVGGAGCDTRAQALEWNGLQTVHERRRNAQLVQWDNAYDDERIKRYYTDAELVREEYAKAFHTDCAEHIYPLSDCDRLQRINPRLKMKELFREIVRQLEILEQNRTWNEYYFLREEIQSQVPMMVDAYYALGAAEIERYNYNMNAIGKQIQENEKPTTADLEKVCGEVYA